LGIAGGAGHPFHSKGIIKRYGDVQFSQFAGAELLAKKFDVSRQELDQSAVASHGKAAAARAKGYFKREIIPIKGHTPDGKEVDFIHDEGIRETDLKQLQKLKLLDPEGGRHTAATASQISDGAAALLIVNERGLKRLKLKPRAKIVALALAGSDPVMMLSGPIPATRRVLKESGLTIDQMDLYEVNEAFGAVPLAWAKELKADLNKLNVNGGAMALGHPLGATGAKLMTTLLHELERRDLDYGLQAICEGGGTANATIIQRIRPEQLVKIEASYPLSSKL